MFTRLEPAAASPAPAVPPGAPSGVPPGAAWQWWDLIASLLFVAAGFLLIGGLLALVDARNPGAVEQDSVAAIVATVGFELSFGLLVLALARRRGLGPVELGFVRPRRWGPLVTAWLGGYVVLVGYQGAVVLLEEAGLDLGWLEARNAIPVGDETAAAAVVLLGVAVVLGAPFAEELYFRALWHRGLQQLWRPLPALVVSGLLFGAFHLNPGVLVPFSLIGVLFAWANQESGSLWTSILAHTGFNTAAFMVAVAEYAS